MFKKGACMCKDLVPKLRRAELCCVVEIQLHYGRDARDEPASVHPDVSDIRFDFLCFFRFICLQCVYVFMCVVVVLYNKMLVTVGADILSPKLNTLQMNNKHQVKIKKSF